MPNPFSFGEVHMDVALGPDPSPQPHSPQSPFRIALLGDFSGRANRGLMETGHDLSRRRIVPVDRDSFDEVLGRAGASLGIPLEGPKGPSLSLHFKELDDFHPDQLFQRASIFGKLRQLRERLADPATFAEAAEGLGLAPATRPAADAHPTAPSTRAAAPDPSRLASGNLLEDLIEQSESQSPHAHRPDELQEFIRRVVAPHLAPEADPRQPEVLARIDRTTSHLMGALLHHPDFQALEAAWRGVFFLVRRIETDSQLQLFLIDISKAELAADLSSRQDLNSTGLYKLLVEQTVRTPGVEPWAVLAANFTFDPTRADANLLGRIAKVASAAGAPFLAATSPGVLGCESIATLSNPHEWKPAAGNEDAEAWRALRNLPEATYLGLALPRFLLRLPYGKDTDFIEQFDFKEMLDPPAHEDYLWGNPAWACVLLLAQAFSASGWRMRPGESSEITGLPLHLYRRDGESQAKPCAEVLLTTAAADRIMEKGVMPLASLKGQDAARLVRFQSLADPIRALSGRWG
ncbi:MAG TPA: type VI secretion system contractile sheath large subunit [Terriglobia bacterium]|nr:type VI secretion system contractile sheath large subunit [Terriglobia bacterium]